MADPYVPQTGDPTSVPGAGVTNVDTSTHTQVDPAEIARQEEEERKKQEAAAARQDYLNHFNYGGVAGGAQATASAFNQQAQAAQGRQGEQINYDMAQGAYGQSQMSAGLSNEMAGLMRQRAMGLVPSIAQQQADRQMQQATAAQSSMAASARGPAGLALAQQQAAGNVAGLQSNISGQAQINAANERMQAEQAAFGAYSGMRGQDLQATGIQADMAQKQAALNAAQRAQNDQYSMGLYGLGNDVNKAQLGAQGNQIGIETGAAGQANALAAQQSNHSDDNWWKAAGLGLGAVGTGLGVFGALGFLGGGNKQYQGTSGIGGTSGDPGAGGYNGNATPDGSNNVGTSGGEYGQGTYGPPDPSDVTAKQNISPLAYGMGQQVYGPDPYASQGLMLSDTRAKQDAYELRIKEAQANAWDEGRAAAMSDLTKLSGKTPQELKAYGNNDMASVVRNTRANAWDEGYGAPRRAPGQYPDASLMQGIAQMKAQLAAQQDGLMSQGSSVHDPITQQFAQGLAPSSYQYKSGIPGATPGMKVGPMAQNMAANPITGTAIRQDPRSGLLAIDGKDGLKVALGGVGHLAQKQQAQGAEIQRLTAEAAAMRAQQLMSQGQGQPPTAPQAPDPRMLQAQQMMADINAQREGLMSQGPSVGQSYLSYVRGQ